MANTLGSVVIEMAVNLARLRSDMGQAATITNVRLREIQRSAQTTVRQLSQVGRSVRSAFATVGVGVGISSIVFSLKEAASAAIEFGDEMAKASAKTGVAGSTFSQLAYAARQNDVQLETLTKSFIRLQKATSEAASGSKTAQDAFRALGLNVEQFRKLAPETQFELVAEQLSRLKDQTDRTRVGTELLGRGYAELAPLLEQGADGIRKLREEAVRTGRSLTEDQINKLSEADLAIKNLTASWESFARSLTATVSPAITSVLDKLNTIGKIDFGSLAAGFLGGPSTGIQNAYRQIAAAEAAVRRQRNLEAISRRPNLIERGEVSATTPPGPTGGGGVASAGSGLSEINVYSREIFNFANEQQAAFQALSQRSAETVQDNMRQIGNDTFRTLEQIGTWLKEGTNEWSVYAEQAARNMQDSFAEFLFDPFKGGLDDMLASFVDVIRQMIAQYAAFQAFAGIGSALAGSSNTFLQSIGGFLKGRASGGPVTAGVPYMVGERGPELFMPRSSGTIIPNGGASAVTVNYSIDARGADADRIMAIMPGLMKQSEQRTVARVQELISRGRLA